MNVYHIEAEHYNVPGRPFNVRCTMVEAYIEAASYVNIMRKDAELPADATPDNWRAKLEELNKHLADEQECDLEEMRDSELGHVDVRILDLPMHKQKITVYTIAIDDDCGTRTEVFTSEEARNEWAWNEVVASHLWGDVPSLQHAKERFKSAREAIHDGECRKYEDSYTFGEHEIEIDAPVVEIALPPIKKYVVAMGDDNGLELLTFDSERERDEHLWDKAWNSTGSDAKNLEEFKAEYSDDLGDAMEAAEISYVTEDI